MDDIILHKDNVSCTINKYGIISRLDINDVYSLKIEKIPIYFFIFEEYSKVNPVCRSFIDDSYIEILDNTCESIIFTKIFTHYNNTYDIKIQYTIKVYLNVFDLKIEILTTLKENHRYGMTMPVYSENVCLCDNSIDYPLINFQRLWDRKWPDQTYTDVPIISIRNKHNYYSILCPIDYNSQYFLHNQDNIKCIRTSTATHYSKELHSLIIKHKTNAKDIYVKYFPHSDSYINFWKTSLKKIQSVHNIHITYDKYSKDNNKFTFQSADYDKISEIIQALSEELDKYNFGMSYIGISEIVLCNNLYKKNKKIYGCAIRKSTIIIDTVNIAIYKETLHHEIFHIIQDRSLMEPYIMKWTLHNNVPDTITTNTPQEEMAELFSRMICNSSFMETLEDEYPDIKQHYLIIEDIFKEATNTCLMWRKKITSYFKRYHDADVSVMNPHSLGVFKDYSSHPDDFGLTQQRKIILLCGMKNSGINLISRYLKQIGIHFTSTIETTSLQQEEYPLIYVQYLKTVQEFDYVYSKLNCQILWMIRDPRYVTENNSEANFLNWININSAILHSKCALMIKYETLIVDDIGVIKEICDFTGHQIKEIKSLIDYDKIDSIVKENYEPLFVKYYGFPILERTRYSAL